MKINIHTNLSDNMDKEEVEVIINAASNCSVLNKIIENIQSISNQIDTLIGMQENTITILNITDIYYFYSKEQSNYCKTKNGDFKIKKKLYELEESLNKNDFIRISNSCIANVKYIKSFDLGKIGNIIVLFSDGTSQLVSKRRISSVIKFLKERGN